MTEDSICRNCLHQGQVEVLHLPRMKAPENVRTWCKEGIELDFRDKVVQCSEFYDRTKVGKIPSADKRRWEKGG